MKLSWLAIALLGLVIFLAGFVAAHLTSDLQLARATARLLPPTAAPTLVTERLPEEEPGVDFPDLPRYPESTRTEYRNTIFGQVLVTEVKYLAETEIGSVRDFYRGIFRTYGWTVVDSGFSADAWTFVAVDDEREAVVEIEPRGSLAEVEIKLSVPLPPQTPTPETQQPLSTTPAELKQPLPATPIPTAAEPDGSDAGDIVVPAAPVVPDTDDTTGEVPVSPDDDEGDDGSSTDTGDDAGASGDSDGGDDDNNDGAGDD